MSGTISQLAKTINLDGFVFHVRPDGSVIECPHDKSTVKLRVIRGGSTQVVRQCDDCLRVVGGAIPKSTIESIDSLAPFDERGEGYFKAYSKAVAMKNDKERAAWFAWYDEYLRSPEWATRRNMVLHRASGVCEGCMESSATQVHHLSYDNVGDELLYQLVAVCDACHEKAHSKKERK